MGGQRGESAGRTARPRPRDASAEQAPAGGAPGERTQSGQGEDGSHAACPTPQQKDKCRATCQCRACEVLTPEGGQRGRPPPPPPPPYPQRKEARATGRRRGGKRDDGSGRRTPPEDTAAGWGGRGTRVRNDPHDRAQGEHAPCKPQRGGRRGCNRRKGRVTTRATRQPPPPSGGTSAVPRACAVLPTCLRSRADSENAPPPAPYSYAHPHKGRGRRGDSEGTWGGAGEKKKHKTNNKGHQHARAGADSKGRRDMAGARGHSKGRGTGGRPWGRRLGGRDQRGGGRGDKSPRTTLVRYPTSGVWGPPRCPYRPHLSASNRVGDARDRWPAARGGTGLGGWPMGLTTSTPYGTYCCSCPVRGCG